MSAANPSFQAANPSFQAPHPLFQAPHPLFYDHVFTSSIMKDPVVASDGFTYERESIKRWCEAHIISPTTGAVMASKVLIPNNSLKSEINQWREANSRLPITVLVKTISGKTFEVETKLGVNVKDFKLQIQDIEGLPPYQQRLIFGGRQINEGTLTEHDVEAGSTITLVPRFIGYSLVIRFSSGRSFGLCLCGMNLSQLTTADIKRRIESGLICQKDPSLTFETVPFDQQRLLLNGKELLDDDFPDPKLHGGCILDLVEK